MTFPFPTFVPAAASRIRARDRALGAMPTLATSHALPLPDHQVGDLLLMFVSGGSTAGARTITTPSGWTQLYNIVGTNSLRRGACFYRTAATSGSGLTETVTFSGTVYAASIVYSIENWQGTPEAATAAAVASTTVDPPSLSPSWGNSRALFFAPAHSYNTATVSAYPSAPYGDSVQVADASISQSKMALAVADVTASSSDPSAYTFSSSTNLIGATVAVRSI